MKEKLTFNGWLCLIIIVLTLFLVSTSIVLGLPEGKICDNLNLSYTECGEFLEFLYQEGTTVVNATQRFYYNSSADLSDYYTKDQVRNLIDDTEKTLKDDIDDIELSSPDSKLMEYAFNQNGNDDLLTMLMLTQGIFFKNGTAINLNQQNTPAPAASDTTSTALILSMLQSLSENAAQTEPTDQCRLNSDCPNGLACSDGKCLPPIGGEKKDPYENINTTTVVVGMAVMGYLYWANKNRKFPFNNNNQINNNVSREDMKRYFNDAIQQKSNNSIQAQKVGDSKKED